MIKVIASDIDGTLLQNGSWEISEEFFREASRLMDLGVKVCAASGRQYKSLRRLFAPVADRMYFLCENGAVVFGPGEEPQLIAKTAIDREKSIRLCYDILAIPDNKLLISGQNTSYLVTEDEEYISLVRDFVGNNTVVLERPEDMPEDFVKISAYYEKGATIIEPMLRPQWEKDFSVAVAGFGWLDFTVADKGTGMKALLDHLGIDAAETMAFGDNYNDIAMLDVVGHPYLMASAVEDLRRRYPVQCVRPEDVMKALYR